MSSKLMMRLCALTTAAVLAGGVAACGDDDDDDSADSAETTTETADTGSVTLTADDAGGDYTFELSATPTAETTEVVFDNQGSEPHALIFARLGEGFTVDEAFELEGRKGSAETLIEGAGAKPGKSTTVPIEGAIEPGNYAMLCPIGGPEGIHYQLGQLEEFTIE